MTSDPGFRKLSDGSIEIDVSKAKSPLTVSGLYHSTAFHQVTVPDEMDFDLCQQLKGLKVGPGRDALLKDWADRLGGTRSPQYRNAVVRDFRDAPDEPADNGTGDDGNLSGFRVAKRKLDAARNFA